MIPYSVGLETALADSDFRAVHIETAPDDQKRGQFYVSFAETAPLPQFSWPKRRSEQQRYLLPPELANATSHTGEARDHYIAAEL
jgi:hypothetical protein